MRSPVSSLTITLCSVCIVRLRGLMLFGCTGSRKNALSRLFSRMPVSSVTTPEPKSAKMLRISEAALPLLSMTAIVVVSEAALAVIGAKRCYRQVAREHAFRARARVVGIAEKMQPL